MSSPLFAFDDSACLDLARNHGTPLFAYHLGAARAAFRRLARAVPRRVRIAYAVKANPHARLLETFTGLGASFDCASAGELLRVAALPVPLGRTFFAGPGKQRGEIALALELGARLQAESLEDLLAVEDLSASPVTVNLRIHPKEGVAEASPILGGTGPSAFGVDEEDAPALLARARELKRVRIGGLHVFAASNERSADRLLATHAMVLALAKRLGLEDAEQVDLGGGLGVPYREDESPLDVEALGAGLARLLDANPWFRGEFVLEPGRFLAAACGVYLVRVVRVKQSRGRRFAILEAGINHLLRPLLTGQPFPVKAPGREGTASPVTLAGPLCTSLDRLGDVDLPDLRAGDLLAFGMAGAYGATEAMPRFLSHPDAKEVAVG